MIDYWDCFKLTSAFNKIVNRSIMNNFQEQRLFGRHYGQVLSRYILENPYRPRMVDKSNPIFAYTVIEFHRRYRLNKKNFLCLFRILHKKLKGNQRQHSIPAINQLLIALRFYASGNFQYDDGNAVNALFVALLKKFRL